jgi:hypothetical protein
MTKIRLLEDIKADPPRYFRAPSDVMRDRRFSDRERLEILTAWEHVARTADDSESDRLNPVLAARAEIEKRLHAETVGRDLDR